MVVVTMMMTTMTINNRKYGKSLFNPCVLLAALIVLLLGSWFPAAAQEAQMVTVPDVTGLSVPAAAALLNTNGLRLGVQSVEGWTAESGLPQNAVSAQSVAAGTSVSYGTAVDVVVLSSPNTALIYDDNDLTVVNFSGGALDINGVSFSANAGAVLFRASRWGSSLRAEGCGQVWSVGRSTPKDVEGCGSIQWLTTNNPAEHFWTALNGVAEFTVVQDGVTRATCPAAPAGTQPLRCEVYLAGGSTSDAAPFVYFTYTMDRFVVMNPTSDQWMPLSQTPIFNFNPGITVAGAQVNLGDPALFGNPPIVADITRLAPGQCLLLTDGSPTTSAPPAPCSVIAQLNTTPQVAFWVAPFEIQSSSDGLRRGCPAATPDKLTICILPR